MSDTESFVEINGSDDEWELVDEVHEDDTPVDFEQVQGVEGITAPKKKTRKVRRRRAAKKALIDVSAPLEQVLIPKDVISPDDNVELLGVNAEEASLLASHSVSTVGQLACFDVLSKLPADHKSVARLLELQEKASEVAMDYVTKMSYTQDVWGYCYVRELDQVRVLKQGYISNDNLLFLLTPIPLDVYRNCRAIDKLAGKEANDEALAGRYSHLIKVNLTQLCKQHNADLYVKESNAWLPLTLAEVETWASKPGMWDAYAPGTDIFQAVTHGKIVLPSDKIPIQCLEFDITHSSKSRQREEEEAKEEEDIPYLEYANKRDYSFDHVPKKSNIFGREGFALEANISHRSSKNNR